MIGLVPTTPRMPLSDRVIALCRVLNNRITPSFLLYTDAHAGYEAGKCHLNVVHRVKQHGGKRANGWIIWESSPFDEAEFHAVWQSPTGKLVDVTPRVDGEKKILFLLSPQQRVIRMQDGIVIPCGRTTNPRMAYMVGNQPSPAPAYLLRLDTSVWDYAKRLGLSPYDMCE